MKGTSLREKAKPVRTEHVWTIAFSDGTVRSTVSRKIATAAIGQLGGNVSAVHCHPRPMRRPRREQAAKPQCGFHTGYMGTIHCRRERGHTGKHVAVINVDKRGRIKRTVTWSKRWQAEKPLKIGGKP